MAPWVLLAALAACADDGPVAPSGSGLPDARTVRCTQTFPAVSTSPYRLPYRAGLSYTLIQGYCAPNPSWGHHDWLAYDFDLALGDTILASRAGTVFAVTDRWQDGTRRCGEENWVFIEHEDHTAMQYVHLREAGALVRVGDVVEAGEPIGLSGDSGCSSGPHLHVALFADRTDFGATNTLPLVYANAEGPLDTRGGLLQDATYLALP